MFPGQAGLELSGRGRASRGRGLRGRRPREMATATSARTIQKFREKRQILGNPIPSPLGFCSHCPRPVLSLTKPRESLCSPGSACGSSAWMYPRTHTHTHHTRRYVYVCTEHRERAGLRPPGCCGRDHPLFPKKIGLGRGELPAASVASAVQLHNNGTPLRRGILG